MIARGVGSYCCSKRNVQLTFLRLITSLWPFALSWLAAAEFGYLFFGAWKCAHRFQSYLGGDRLLHTELNEVQYYIININLISCHS